MRCGTHLQSPQGLEPISLLHSAFQCSATSVCPHSPQPALANQRLVQYRAVH